MTAEDADQIIQEAQQGQPPAENCQPPASTPETPQTTPTRSRRVRNPEVIAMDRIDEILCDLDPAARARVLAWVNSQYPITKEQQP
jgi:hypothetical protein